MSRILPRRRASLVALGAILLASVTLTAAPAHADKTVIQVVGTSDVYDSNLFQMVIEPNFERAYPQYDLQYISKGTGAAITYAKQGAASAMIVHAASLENQFVDQGWSLEGYGRAIFWGDYVLLGPADDPAGVLNGAQHDIVGAFEKVAAAGAAGTANFVSRGGTPGTTVQEHAIWALANGVTTCTVSAANGGGVTPSTATGDCPTSVPLPSWYKSTGLTQAPNVLNGNACNYDVHKCYVFTDRGTFNYLQSTGQITSLGVVTRDNTGVGAPGGTARGGVEMLVNSFHAYAIDPDAPGFNAIDPANLKVDKAAGMTFLNWITSPDAQSKIGDYLASDPPFLPSASPAFTTTAGPASVTAGQPITVTGNVANVVPGYPALDGLTVHLLAAPASAPGSTPTQVASGTTDAEGDFSITYTPTASSIYSVSTDAFEKVQIPTLSPAFGDRLAAGTAEVGQVELKARFAGVTTSVKKGILTVTGVVAPKARGNGATVLLSVGKLDKRLKPVSWVRLANGKARFSFTATLGTSKQSKGRWKITLVYDNPLVLTSATKSVVVSN